MLKIGFIGCGWRAKIYFGIIKQMPELFEISGIYCRSEESAAKWPGLSYTDFDAFLNAGHDCIFMLTPPQSYNDYLVPCLKKDLPVLLETPPQRSLEGMQNIWETVKAYNGRVQVAEQYYLQPYHRAVQTIVDKGIIGTTSNVRLSMMHDYHAISVMRKLLGTGMAPCTVSAQAFHFPVQHHCGREGLTIASEKIAMDERKVASIAFENGKIGFYDFAGEQYFNYFRTRHMNVQGDKGEINDYDITYLNGEGRPVFEKLLRYDLGHDSNLEGYNHSGMYFRGERIYDCPYTARLGDDEIAMAAILDGMAKYIQDGTPVYSLEDALQDMYLTYLMNESVRIGAPVTSEKQNWQ